MTGEKLWQLTSYDSDILSSLPTWPHSRKWGYYPSGGLGLIALILIILLVAGRF